MTTTIINRATFKELHGMFTAKLEIIDELITHVLDGESMKVLFSEGYRAGCMMKDILRRGVTNRAEFKLNLLHMKLKPLLRQIVARANDKLPGIEEGNGIHMVFGMALGFILTADRIKINAEAELQTMALARAQFKVVTQTHALTKARIKASALGFSKIKADSQVEAFTKVLENAKAKASAAALAKAKADENVEMRIKALDKAKINVGAKVEAQAQARAMIEACAWAAS